MMYDELISRQAAIDKAYLLDLSDTGNSIEIRVIDASDIEQLPSAQPEQKTGRWELAIGYDPKRRVMCDQCAKMAYEPSKYCPHCGAKMEGE